MDIKTVRILSLVALLLSLGGSVTASASALISLSVSGIDKSDCGSPAQPCRSLQYAHDVVDPSGEIDIVDAGDFGGVTISKSLKISNKTQNGVVTSPSVAISGAQGPVTLNGITIDGGVPHGQLGLNIRGPGVVNVVNSHILNHTAGVAVSTPQATTKLLLQNTTVESNQYYGVFAGSFEGGALVLDLLGAKILGNARAEGSGVLLVAGLKPGSTATATINSSTLSNNGVALNVFNPVDYSGLGSVYASVLGSNIDGNLFEPIKVVGSGGPAVVNLQNSTIASSIGQLISNSGIIQDLGGNTITTGVSGNALQSLQ